MRLCTSVNVLNSTELKNVLDGRYYVILPQFKRNQKKLKSVNDNQ